jgi:hypothetical protein
MACQPRRAMKARRRPPLWRRGFSRLTNECAWNAVSAFANCGRAVAHVRGSSVPTSRHMQCSKFGAYSISSSAAADSPIGTSRPSAFAVLRLMTRFNLVGCWTGRSDGAFTLENTAGVDAYLMNRDDPGRRDRVADQVRLRPAAHRARAALSPSRMASKTRARARPAGTSLPPHACRRAGSSARARAASPP